MRGGKEVPCALKRVKPGLHVCSFTPRQVGLHLIDVMLDGIALPGWYIINIEVIKNSGFIKTSVFGDKSSRMEKWSGVLNLN